MGELLPSGEGGGDLEGEGGFAGTGVTGEEGDSAAGDEGMPEPVDLAFGDGGDGTSGVCARVHGAPFFVRCGDPNVTLTR